jgi:penicillin-binding protein 1A
MKKINRSDNGRPAAPRGRRVNTSNSRREPQHAPRSGREPEELQESCEKKKHPLLRFIGRTIATLLCLGVMAGSLLAMIPMVILYLIFQKQFIQGIAMTGGK